MERIEDDWGAWGALYRDDDGRLLGSIQYGPATLFPRATELPAGPPSDDAVLVTCVYVVSTSTPWVEQSLFLAAIGDARDKGAKALEAFAYRYPEGESTYERFLVHRTVFPRDFLADFGFTSVRAQGRVELSRLELGGLVPVVEGKRAAVLRVVKEAFAPAPVPQRPVTAPPSRRDVIDSPDVSVRSCGNYQSTFPTPPARPSRSLQLQRLPSSSPARRPTAVGCAAERLHGHARRDRREPDRASAFTPDGRLLVTTQFGALRVVENGTLSPTAVVDLGPKLCTANEMGLLGVAVDPAFAGNGYVYLYSSRDLGGECVNRVSRYTMSGNTIAESTRARARRRDPGDERQPQRRRSPVRPRRLPLRQRRRRRLRLRGRRLLRPERRVPRPARARREDPADHEHRRHPAGQSLRRRRHGALQRHRSHDRRHEVPGDVCVGPAEPVPDRVRPERGRHAASSSTTSARAPGRKSNAGLAGADYGWNVREGPCANGSETNCGPQPAGMTNPIVRLQPRRVELPRDHRRCVRPERDLAERRTTAPTSTATTPAGRSSSSRRTGRRLHAHGVRHRRRRGRQPRLRPGAAGARRSTTRTTRTAARCVGSSRPSFRTGRRRRGSPQRPARARCRWPSASTAARARIRMRATRSRTRGTSATGRRR